MLNDPNDGSFEDFLSGTLLPEWKQQCYDDSDHMDEPVIVIWKYLLWLGHSRIGNYLVLIKWVLWNAKTKTKELKINKAN